MQINSWLFSVAWDQAKQNEDTNSQNEVRLTQFPIYIQELFARHTLELAAMLLTNKM